MVLLYLFILGEFSPSFSLWDHRSGLQTTVKQNKTYIKGQINMKNKKKETMCKENCITSSRSNHEQVNSKIAVGNVGS